MSDLTEKGVLLIITGPTAVGKNTVREELFSKFPTFQKIITYTSRPVRKGETHGVHYHFVGEKAFESMIEKKELLEHVIYGSYYKGTHKDSISSVLEGKSTVWIIDMSRAAKIKETFEKRFSKKTANQIWKRTSVVLVDVKDWKTLRERATKRDGDSFEEREFKKRVKQDLKVRNKFDQVVFNEEGKLKNAVSQIIKLINT